MEDIFSYISKVNDWFVNKLLKEEYEILNIDQHTVEVRIGGFIFNLWIANSVENFRCYYAKNNFMELTFDDNSKEILYTRFTTLFKEERIKTLEKYKLDVEERLNELKNN